MEYLGTFPRWIALVLDLAQADPNQPEIAAFQLFSSHSSIAAWNWRNILRLYTLMRGLYSVLKSRMSVETCTIFFMAPWILYARSVCYNMRCFQKCEYVWGLKCCEPTSNGIHTYRSWFPECQMNTTKVPILQWVAAHLPHHTNHQSVSSTGGTPHGSVRLGLRKPALPPIVNNNESTGVFN